MTDFDDLPVFEPRIGIRHPAASGREGSFRNTLLARLRRGAAAARRSPRGGAGARQAKARRVVVKAHVVRMSPSGAKAAALHLRYIERAGVEKDGSKGVLYAADGPVHAETFEQPRAGEKHQFRLIVSPEDGSELDLTAYVRRLLATVERDLGRRIEWAAVNHRWDEPAPTGAPMTPAQNRKTDLPPAAETAGAPACSEAQVVARRLGAQGRSVVRNVGLDLGARHIAYCEVADGQVVERATFRSLAELERKVGPGTPDARVAFEACREGWHVHDTLRRWGKEPVMLDTTRVRQIGVGQHGRKNDALDAEAMARALDAGRVPLAHVLSPERRALRAKLSIRGELVDMRARQVTILRGLARAAGVLLPTGRTGHFLAVLECAPLDAATRALVAPIVATLTTANEQIALVEDELAQMAKADPMIRLCASAPSVGLIVGATFISVLDDAKRFRNAHAVGAYLGLVPGENTTGGKQRLGSITKHGNSHARAMLVQSAWQMLRSGAKDDPLYRWASHLAQVRGKKIAVVALARKLAGVLWAMCRDGTVYDAALQARESSKGLKQDAQSTELRAQAMARAAAKFQRRERKRTTASTSASPRAKTSRVNGM